MLSEMAKRIFADLYSFSDESIDDTFKRVSREFGNELSGDIAYDLMKKNIWRPSTPIFFNAGSVKKIFAACWVSDLEDSMDSIYDTANVARKIFQSGAGIGIPIGKLREKEAPIFEGQIKEGNTPSGQSSGPISFMTLFDAVGATTKSGGRARRAAIMCVMPISHPDIMEFIECKNIDGVLSNMNISVSIPDDFMQAFKDNIPYHLVSPANGPVKEVNARVLWDKIVDMAHKTADPGVLFIDTINKFNPLKKIVKIECTNPCITGDTLIAVADGRNAVTICDLAKEGVDVPVYSTSSDGQVQIKMGRNPRKTGDKKEVWIVTLDDDSTFKATPDHKILLKDMTYSRVDELSLGVSLFPFNSFISNKKYRQITNSGKLMSSGSIRRNRRQYRLIHEFYNGEIDPKIYAIHHKNIDSSWDNIENLEVMLHEEHRKLHTKNMMGKKNPYFKMNDEWKQKFAKHSGESNGRYNGKTNDDMIEKGREILKKYGVFTQSLWQESCRKEGFTYTVNNEFRFGSFNNFKSIVLENHKVIKSEFFGYEDVYNITVDDNHNYHIITSGDSKYMESSGLCVKNCGEQPLVPYTSCNLSSINVHKFCTSAGEFKYNELYTTAYEVAVLMDNLIDNMDFPDERFKKNVLKYRPMGVGIMGLSDALYELGLAYDSKDGQEFAEEVMKTVTTACLEASSDLAKDKGTFTDYDKVRDDVLEIVSSLIDDDKVIEKIKKYGLRNCQHTTIAPTGSIALSCDCSYGMEPSFGLVFTKTLVESGDSYTLVNPIFKRKYENETWYTSEIIEKIIQNGGSLKGIRGIPKEVRDVFVVAHDIKAKDRIDMQAVLQKHVSTAISSTTNLPTTATRDEVSELYRYAYQKGLKGITIYRDGSKKTQPITFTNKEKTVVASNFDRPSKLQANVHIIETGNGKMYVTVSTHNGRAVEIFLSMGKSGQLFNTFCEALGRTVSIALQHGTPLEAIIKTLEGINSDRPTWFRFEETDKKPSQILSIPDAIAQLLERYYKAGEKDVELDTNGELCQKCGRYTVVMIEGCSTCTACGESKCG